MARFSLISAALRHVRDAQHLLEPGPHQSIDQALHLAGFGPECARKGCIDEALADRALGHDIRGAGDAVIDFLLAIDPSASRYNLDRGTAGLPIWQRHWRPERRYDASGSSEPDVVRALVEEARSFVDSCVGDLFCDGALDVRVLR